MYLVVCNWVIFFITLHVYIMASLYNFGVFEDMSLDLRIFGHFFSSLTMDQISPSNWWCLCIAILNFEYFSRPANPRKYAQKTFDGIFLFKVGNHARKYQYGPSFQNHPVAKMAFDLEGQIWGQKIKWGQFFIFNFLGPPCIYKKLGLRYVKIPVTHAGSACSSVE